MRYSYFVSFVRYSPRTGEPSFRNDVLWLDEPIRTGEDVEHLEEMLSEHLPMACGHVLLNFQLLGTDEDDDGDDE